MYFIEYMQVYSFPRLAKALRFVLSASVPSTSLSLLI